MTIKIIPQDFLLKNEIRTDTDCPPSERSKTGREPTAIGPREDSSKGGVGNVCSGRPNMYNVFAEVSAEDFMKEFIAECFVVLCVIL